MSGENHDSLKLQLGTSARGVDAEAFVAFFRHAIDALKAIDRGLSTHGVETLRWDVVNAGSNSPIFATLHGESLLDHNGHYGEEVIAVFVGGLDHLRESNTCPPRFTRDALRYVKRLVQAATSFNLDASVSAGASHISIERPIGANADWAIKVLDLQKPRYTEYGAIEGTLKGLSTSGEHRDKLVLVDRLTGEETPCYLREDLDTKAREAWKKRVVVTGQLVINRHTKKNVELRVEDIRILRDRSELPQFDDLHGIDITDGMTAADYIRDLRDDG